MYAALLLKVVGHPEVDLNRYPMICNSYNQTIKFCRCEWAEDLLCYKSTSGFPTTYKRSPTYM